MISSSREVINVRKNTTFYSEPSLYRFDVPEGFRALHMELDIFRVVIHTVDPEFSLYPKRFEGEIEISHDSSWEKRVDMLGHEMVQVFFRFPEKDGGRQVLSAYIYKNLLSKLKECWNLC